MLSVLCFPWTSGKVVFVVSYLMGVVETHTKKNVQKCRFTLWSALSMLRCIGCQCCTTPFNYAEIQILLKFKLSMSGFEMLLRLSFYPKIGNMGLKQSKVRIFKVFSKILLLLYSVFGAKWKFIRKFSFELSFECAYTNPISWKIMVPAFQPSSHAGAFAKGNLYFL